MSLSILVIGSENPRIRDLFRAIGRDAHIRYLDTASVTTRPNYTTLLNSWRWHKSRSQPPEATLVIPKRWQDVHIELTHWFCRKSFAYQGKPDVIVFTWPQLAPLAEKFPDVKRIYYCKDPFESWCWGPEVIRPLESRMLACVDATFAVSRLLVEDFKPRAAGKVFYLPNGVEDEFLTADLKRPANLPASKPVLGSVGQINVTYDWDYIGKLSAALPDAQLCFVGNVDEDNGFHRAQIIKTLTTTPNIHWLGRQPHGALPAYLRHFDISMCFLKANAFGDRRSPLRLYDYLSTDRPIISTPVREAFEHQSYIHIAQNGNDAAEIAREILAGKSLVDVNARKRYISQNTWSTRAREFLDGLRTVGTKPFPVVPAYRPAPVLDRAMPLTAFAKPALSRAAGVS